MYSTIDFVFHLTAFFIFGWANYYLEVKKISAKIASRHPKGDFFLGMWKYLTHWNLNIQFVFYGICLLCDFWQIESGRLVQFRDTVFHGLAFPTAWYVAITFWAIYAVNRQLIFPRYIDKFYPFWLNQTTHTLVAVFTLIESYLSYHKEPSDVTGLFLLVALFLAYAVFTFYAALVKDYWIYPVMEKMNWPGRIGMVLGGFPLVATFYYVGVFLHLSFWPQR